MSSRRALASEPLIDFIPRVARGYHRPEHLAPLLAALDEGDERPLRIATSAPPRHAKTDSVLLHLVRRLLRRPSDTVAYITFGERMARDKSRRARQFAVRAGLELRPDAKALDKWLTPAMGGAIFTSTQGPLTGQGINLLVIDDPHKGRAEAESQLDRDRVWEWYTGVALDRLEPGATIVCTHTRWHPDDLMGRLLKEQSGAWRHINLQAVDEEGRALWPSRWPVEAFEDQRVNNAYEWFSKYQGTPRARGGRVFNDVHFYDELPRTYRAAVGVDLAYTAKTYADWSVAIVLLESDGRFYVRDVVRRQCQPPEFAGELRSIAASYPGAQMRWYGSVQELGLAQLMCSDGKVPLQGMRAATDKFVRAQPAAGAWNTGKILLPRTAAALSSRTNGSRPADGHAPDWVADLVSEVSNFTGVNDRHDDQVDALAAAFDALASSGVAASGSAEGLAFEDAGIGI